MNDKTKAPTAPSEAAPKRVRVILPEDKRPGLISAGPYKPGQVYEVDPAEAERLITVKGFEPAP